MSEQCNTTIGILLLGFGGPEAFKEVRPFIERVVAGRRVPQERIDAVVEQYRIIGGKSPFNGLTHQQAQALQTSLQKNNCPAKVYVGFLYSQPSIQDTITTMEADGIKSAVAIVMAPQRSEASFQRYANAIDTAVSGKGWSLDTGKFAFVESWHTNPLFTQAIADCVIDQLSQLGADELAKTSLIFTAHSIPVEMSDKSGYARQIEETSRAVVEHLQNSHGKRLPWSVAYQSRSGNPGEPWLEPDVQADIARVQQAGQTHVCLVPVGFVVDHVEILFDLDVLAAQTAQNLGMIMLRAKTVGIHPKFIQLLAELSEERIESPYSRIRYARSDARN